MKNGNTIGGNKNVYLFRDTMGAPGQVNLRFTCAHGLWIIEDGYFDNYGRTKTVLLCTESFTKAECVCLQEVLANFNIKTSQIFFKPRKSPKEI